MITKQVEQVTEILKTLKKSDIVQPEKFNFAKYDLLQVND